MAMIIGRKYEVVSTLGQGGMGVVYEVRHTTLERISALKVLPAHLLKNQDMITRFYHEAQVMAQLNHPNIVQVIDFDREEDLYYLVMEYIAGKTLSQYVGERGPLSLSQVLEIASQVASALACAHQHSPPIIHRDIKPANIMIEDSSGRVVVMDFGIAKELGNPEGGETKAGMVMGTVKYAAPEQLRGEPLDGRVDIYALGLVMYEMYTGQQLFAGLEEVEVIGKVVYEPHDYHLQFARPTPAAFQALLTKALAKDRRHRYQHMEDLLRDLEMCRTAGQAEEERTATIALARVPESDATVLKQGASDAPAAAVDFQPSVSPLVGREAELERLHGWLEKALRGQRQVVFVTGEPGIGKTTMMEAFLQHASARGGLWIGRGQCVEHYGAGEAYLPVLEALGRLCRESEGVHLIELLGRYAPTWLVQMPALISTAELEAVQRKVQGATQERMLRELAEAVEALTAEQGLILCFEDLHWSDPSTLDLLAYVAQQRGPARLLVVGTYRPAEVIGNSHSLKGIKQELHAHGLCAELELPGWTTAEVSRYLATRFAQLQLPPLQLGQTLHRSTEGNPLFVVNVVDDLLARGVVRAAGGQWQVQGELEEVVENVPESVRELIEGQIGRLSEAEQQVLEVASVVGVEFSAAAVAAGADHDLETVEECCGALARREHFLRPQGTSEWPDGTVAARYSFLHALYQEVLYEQIVASRCTRLHRQIGDRIEQAYGKRAREIAAELALHFECGRQYHKAVQYLHYAGDNALRRSAHQEAIVHFTKGLELLATLPTTQERARQELVLQTALGPAWMMAKGYAAPEMENTYSRALALCQQVGEPPELPRVLMGLWNFYLVRARLHTARELGEQLLTRAQGGQDPVFLSRAHAALGETLFHLGELTPACAHLQQGIECFDLHKRDSRTVQDPRVACLSYASWTLWHLGYPDRARQKSAEALALARELAQPADLAFALGFAGWFYRYRREVPLAHEQAEATIALTSEQGFPFWLAFGIMVRGWVLAQQGHATEGIAQMRQGLAAYRTIGSEVGLPHILAALAEMYGQVGQSEEGLTVLAEALALMDHNDNRYEEAEVYRLKGQLTLQCKMPAPQAQAEECFQRAIAIARHQEAKSLELRAVMSLSRLWQQQGKTAAARPLLAEMYGWFTEGFDTADLQDAKALLDELA